MSGERPASSDFLRPPGAGAPGVRRARSPWLTGSVAGAVALGVVAFGSGLAHGAPAARVVLEYFAPVLVATVVAVVLVARWVRDLRRQLLWAWVLASVGTVLGVVAFVETMFLSPHDAYYTVLVSLSSLVVLGWSVSLFFGRALRDVAAAERARSDMIAAISHDLRTPLTSLRLLSQAMEDGLGGDDDLRLIQSHVRSLGVLLDDLFELADLESGDRPMVLETMHVDDLVAETLDALRHQAAAESVELSEALPPGLSAVSANPEQLQRVLFNLVQNAIRHTPAGGSVSVGAVEDERRVVIDVADTGDGIPDQERDRIFEAFFQGGVRAARGDGSGLGLAIARAIIEAHGGRIWLAPRPAHEGDGATFCFSLVKAAGATRSARPVAESALQ